MVERGHEVTVYCQATEKRKVRQDEWRKVKRVFLYGSDTPVGTILFDLKSVLHAASRDGLVLTLGYNTAVFSLAYVLHGCPSLINMDGLEWMRKKWSLPQRWWLRLNEYAGAHLSTHLIADHPEIGKHLQRMVPADKITVIPYGADTWPPADLALLKNFGCEPWKFALLVARPEPENSVLQIVEAFSMKPRGYPLIVLGHLDPDRSPYHRKMIQTASAEVSFPGAIYDTAVVQALRQYASFHIHGHQVGGTNPSLVEALAAGSPVIAHGNRFNRWVANGGARYFTTEAELDEILLDFERHPEQMEVMRTASRKTHRERFQTDTVNRAYESLLLRYV